MIRVSTRRSSGPAARRDGDPSPVRTGSAKEDGTRSLKRKSSPDPTASRKRTKVSELVESYPSAVEGLSDMKKWMESILSQTPSEDSGEEFDPFPRFLSSGSVKDVRTRSLKRKASSEIAASNKRSRVSELAEPSTNSEREGEGNRTVEEDGEGPSNSSKRICSAIVLSEASSEDPSEGSRRQCQGVKRKAADVGEGPSTKKSRNLDLVVEEDEEEEDQRAQFEATYEEQYCLGEGGCGSVFAGYRKSDNLPVAIKHVPKDSEYHKQMNKNKQLCTEVAIMLKLRAAPPGSVGASAPIDILDWFDLDRELILVLERPVPSKDLLRFIWDNGASLEEETAKIILKQLIDAALHLENVHIFHRDIKIENILIETGSDVPRLRLIDFGLSCCVEDTSCFHVFYGTPQHIPPEFYSHQTYTAGPTTVWQIGVVLFDMLHRPTRFDTSEFLDKQLTISGSLSKECKDFLTKCFCEVPEQRPTVEELRRHPWLR